MESIELGAKIRGFRKDKGMSMQMLADMVNITPSMLSQIERDLANPSINTLKLISNALNVPLFQLFTSTPDKAETIVRKGERKKIVKKGNEDNYEMELLTPDTTGTIEFMIQKFKPGGNSGESVQAHDGEEVAYVKDGTLELKLDDKIYVLNRGDSVRIPAMVPHLWNNRSDKDASLIFAINPPCF